MQARQTAFKVWIKDLVSGEYAEEQGEFGSNYILINGNKVSRANILASVVEKYVSDDKNYVSVMLDDGFGTIRIKSWRGDTNLIVNLEVGDVILIIGRVRKYNNEVYLTPEIARKIDSNWLNVRRMELVNLYGEPNKEEIKAETLKEDNPTVINEKVVDTETERQKIMQLIDSTDEGIGIDDVVSKSGLNNAKIIVDELLRGGEIFELKGKLRTIS